MGGGSELGSRARLLRVKACLALSRATLGIFKTFLCLHFQFQQMEM